MSTGLAAVLALGLSACSSGEVEPPPDPITIVSGPASVADPISLDIPLDDSGAFAFDKWPSACALTDKATLTAVFPHADVAQTGTDRTVKVYDFSLGARDNRRQKEATIPQAECETRIGFPVEGLRLEDKNVVFQFTSKIEAAGTKEFVEKNTRTWKGEQKQIGNATCLADEYGYGYRCKTEQVAFEIRVDARPYAQYLDSRFLKRGSVFIIDGKQITYSHSNEHKGYDTMAKEKVLLPVVTSAIERLGSSKTAPTAATG